MTRQDDIVETDKIFGFLKPQPGKGSRLGSAYDWARAKAIADIPVEEDRKLWRVHDALYDFSDFDHPGGWDWLDVTRGNDITELVESSHPNIEKIRQILPKYLIRSCSPKTEPRNSGAFTFEKNGFYCTFRDRAWNILKTTGTGPTAQMLLIHDLLLVTFLALIITAVLPFMENYWYYSAVIAGFVLQCLGTCSHNFYHKKPNWRMYTWDITPYSSYEWKISHAYSHHTFPNTAYDYEVTVFEPFLYFLPVKKSILQRILTPVSLLMISLFGMHIQSIQRYAKIITGQQKPRWPNLIPFLLLFLLVMTRLYFTHGTAGTTVPNVKQAFWVCFKRQNVVYLMASLFFHNISLGAGHHNPLIWHQGDDIVESVDWGIFQIISVARFETIDKSLLLTSTTFGNHAMHHLLPTVDHSKLPLVYSVFIETCKEFGINFDDEWFSPRGTKVAMMKGWVAMFTQTFRTAPSSTNYPFHLAKKMK